MIQGIQLIGVFVGLFMLYYSYVYIKRKEFTMKEAVFWLMVWIALIALSLFPQVLNAMSWYVFRVQRTMDMLIIFGFFFLAMIIFYMYTLVRTSQRQIDAIVRNLALEKVQKKKK
ncbi:DUF2304 domain-containing protein [Candidatus Woesearchaeota archaeon]|nr:hypothetical protein [uncultured archaeon]MBS3142072.1 DUF2304 domain-containing protein [Candidatus Woesearchaeota archaeon]